MTTNTTTHFFSQPQIQPQETLSLLKGLLQQQVILSQQIYKIELVIMK